MTVDEMIQQCASDLEERISKTGDTYTGKSLVLAKRILTGINYAYQKIAKEKDLLIQEDNVTLDADNSFAKSALSLPLVRIMGVFDSNNRQVDWQEIYLNKYKCACYRENDTVTVQYSYLPQKLTIDGLNDSPLFDETKADHLLMCYYANFYVASLEGDNTSKDLASIFMDLFNNGVDNIIPDFYQTFMIRMEKWG